MGALRKVIAIRSSHRRLVAGLVVCAALALGGCEKTYEWHQKTTVTVETPDGTVSGSSVILVSATPSWSVDGKYLGNAVKMNVTGEATVVEVRPGKYLFALLDGAKERASIIYYAELPHDQDERWSALQAMRGGRHLPRDDWPRFVTFGSLAEPSTVRGVDPDDLSATFGAGYAVVDVEVEITDQSITESIVHVLPWLAWSESEWISKAPDGLEPMRIEVGKGLTQSLPRTEFRRGFENGK